MKKQFTALAAFALSLLLAACGSSADTVQSTAETTASSVAEASSADSTEAVPEFQAQTIVDNEFCTMILESLDENGMWGYSWKVQLENKTDKNLMFGIDDCSVNGVMADPFWSSRIRCR